MTTYSILCAAPSPDGRVQCTNGKGHAGNHASMLGFLRWSDSEAPHGFYTRHDSPDYADGGMAAAAIEKEAGRVELADDPAYWHAKFCEARQERDEAVRERDELRQTRRRLLGKVDQLEVKLRNSGGSGEQPRALTPDAITEQMIERARRAADAWGHQLLPESMAHILAAALAEPPERPEWADLADKIDDAMTGPGGIDGDTLAERLHAGGVRVVTEEQP